MAEENGGRGGSISGWAAALIGLGVALPVLVNGLVLAQPYINPVLLYRDPLLVADLLYDGLAETAGEPVGACCAYWVGAASNVGVLVWAATAGALFSGLMTAWAAGHASRRETAFLALAFGLTALLAADDVFQIHEQQGLVFGLKGEAVLFPLFAGLLGAYALFRDVVVRPYVVALGIAVVCFGASVLADQVMPRGRAAVVTEDVFKLFGISFWFVYHTMAAVEIGAGRGLFFRRPRPVAE